MPGSAELLGRLVVKNPYQIGLFGHSGLCESRYVKLRTKRPGVRVPLAAQENKPFQK